MIGLAAEAHAARKASKAARAAANNDTAQESTSRSATLPPHAPSSQIPRINLPDPAGTTPYSKHGEAQLGHGSEVAQFGTPDEPPPPYSGSGVEEDAREKDEADWELDDAVEDEEDEQQQSDFSDTFDPGPVPSSKEGRQHYVDKIVSAFLARHPTPPPDPTTPTAHLPCPVIIPQRRPHDKKRGFVRAYAPVLQSCGIDQDSFLAFLKAMHQSSKASPVFNVINIAAFAAGFVPSITAMIVTTVAQAAAMAAIEVQGNLRTNDFLAQLNAKYFRPRGLFCLIFKYIPGDDATHEAVDISSTILKSIDAAPSRFRQVISNAGRASGRTVGELEMPQAAPLIFPALDDMQARGAPKTKKENMKRKGKFVADYFDRRAQAAYTAENPNSVLASANTQKHVFASRFADPNHPANSGHPIALITGGIINPKAQEQQQQQSGLSGILGGRRSPSPRDYSSSNDSGGGYHGYSRVHDRKRDRNFDPPPPLAFGGFDYGGPLGLVGTLASMAISRSRSNPSLSNSALLAAYGGSGSANHGVSYPNPPAPYGGSGNGSHGGGGPAPYSGSSNIHSDESGRLESLRRKELELEERERRLGMRFNDGNYGDRGTSGYDLRGPTGYNPETATVNQSQGGQNHESRGLIKRILNPVCLIPFLGSCLTYKGMSRADSMGRMCFT